jgi:hypothetical protein
MGAMVYVVTLPFKGPIGRSTPSIEVQQLQNAAQEQRAAAESAAVSTIINELPADSTNRAILARQCVLLTSAISLPKYDWKSTRTAIAARVCTCQCTIFWGLPASFTC